MARCFISYTHADEPWAKWIAAVLDEAGHEIILQASSFRPGENFVLRMQEAASSTDHTLVVLSSRYLGSGFGAVEWTAAFAADPTGVNRKLIPIAIEPIIAAGLWKAIIRVELYGKTEEAARGLLLDAVGPQYSRVNAPFPESRISSEPSTTQASGNRTHGPTAIEVWRLPTSASELVGRDGELSLVRNCWDNQSTNLVTVVGWGGCGKTALLNRWLAEMAASQYKNIERIFAWSFDSQAEGGQVATSDQFVDAALRFFGAEESQPASVWERCRKVTALFQQSRSLLILDGLDRLQEPPGRAGGKLREPALKMMVRELASFNLGLCIITSRVPIIDVQQFIGQTCANIEIGVLSAEEGTRLLSLGGLHGDSKQLDEVAREAGYHPLTLTLLGSFVRAVYHGDLSQWKGSALATALENTLDDTAGRVMDEYEKWFRDRPESQILTVIGLFDRPASVDEFRAIRAQPVVNGLNDHLVGMTDVEWAYAISNLNASGLLMVRPEDAATVDAHPLVRSHFGHLLRRESPSGWREGHRRLCEHLVETAPDRPSRLEECLPLMSAIWHGTQAGLAAQMLADVYWPRLAQDNHQLRDVLGAAASNYEVLSYIISGDGNDGSAVSGIELARILCDQAIDLRIMGKPQEAVAPLQRAAELARQNGEHRVAVNALRHLAQLYLTIGRVAEAYKTASTSVEASGALDSLNLDAIAARISLAHIAEHMNDSSFAMEHVAALLTVFADHTVMQRYSSRITLYIQIYRCVEISVHEPSFEGGYNADKHSRESQLNDQLSSLIHNAIALNRDSDDSDLPRSLMRLASCLLVLATGNLGLYAANEIDVAVSEIRESGQRPWLVQALLIRSRLRRRMGAFDAATDSLNEARALCQVDGMVIALLDCDYESAMISIARGHPWQARLMLNALTGLASRHGYRRLHEDVKRLSDAVARLTGGEEPGP